MRKKIGCLLAGATLFSASAMATQSMELLLSSLTFKPNTPVSLANPFIFPLKVNCKITTIDETANFEIAVIKKSATINGTVFHAGENFSQLFSNGQALKLASEGYAEVKITNKGLNDVVASCNLA